MSSTELSRRALLLSGAGMLALAGCGKEEKVVPKAVTFRSGSFLSKLRGGVSTGWSIAWPKGHGEANLPVVIALHGRGGSHRNAFSKLQMAQALDAVVASGTPVFAVASVDGGTHSYWHRRTDGTDAGAMVGTEFVPLLAEHGLDTSRLGLYGWSMGGYGAMLLAGRDQLSTKAVAVSSPALFTSGGSTSAGAFDSVEDFDRHDVFGNPDWLRDVNLRVDCGEQDPFYSATSQFVDQLTPRPAGGFVRGAHDDVYWRQVLPGQLAFLGERLNG